MNYLLLLISILIPIILGFCILFLIQKWTRSRRVPNKDQCEHRVFTCMNIILSFGLGTGILTFLMFWWGFSGLPLKYFIIFIIVLTVILSIFLFLKFFKSRRAEPLRHRVSKWLQNVQKKMSSLFPRARRLIPRLTILEIILLLIIIFQIGFVVSESVLRPHVYVDVLGNWGLRAKMIFYQSNEFFNSQSDIFLGGGGHQHYPLHTPLFMTWIYFLLGQVNDAMVNIIFGLYFTALIGFVYFSLRAQNITKKIALIFTAILSTIPLLTYHGFQAYADLPLAFYFTLSAVFLFKYFKTNNHSDLILAGLFAGFSVWTKNTGLVFAGVLIIAFIIYLFLEKKIKKQGKDFLLFISYFLIISGPWIAFKHFFTLSPTGTPPLREFHPEILTELVRQIFFLRSFHIWAGIFILILILRWRKILIRHNFYLFLIIGGSIAAYFLLYFFTTQYQYVLDGTAVGRNFLAIVPVSIFLAGILSKDNKE